MNENDGIPSEITNRELIPLNNNTSEKNSLVCLQKMLSDELSHKEVNYDRVSEITESIREMAEGEKPPESDSENIEKILNMLELRKRQKIQRVHKFVSAVSACLVIGFSLNLCSLSVFGTNILDSALNITRDGFKINLFDGSIFHPVTTTVAEIATETKGNLSGEEDGNQSSTVTSNTMQGVVEEIVNISPIISDYCFSCGLDSIFIPNNLNSLNVPINLESRFYEESGLSKDVYMTFSDSERKFNVTAEKYYNRDDIPNVLVPADTDSTSVETLDINGIKVHIFEYEKYSSAVYASGDTVYTLTYFNVPDGKMYEIAGSLTYYIAGSEGR